MDPNHKETPGCCCCGFFFFIFAHRFSLFLRQLLSSPGPNVLNTAPPPPFSLRVNRFVCVLTSLTGTQDEAETRIHCLVRHLTYLPADSEQLTHISCCGTLCLADVFNQTFNVYMLGAVK